MCVYSSSATSTYCSFTGGSSKSFARKRHYRSESQGSEDDEYVRGRQDRAPTRAEQGKTTKRAPKRTVSKPPRDGGPTRPDYRTMNRQEYYAIRKYDWYENVPKDDHIDDQNFWCQEQIYIY